MKHTTVVALGLLLSLMSFNISYAQSVEDPFGEDFFGDLFSELESFSEDPEVLAAEEDTTSGSSSSSSSSSGTSSSTPLDEPQSSDESDLLLPSDNFESNVVNDNARSYVQNIPEGKENFLLYNVPGAVEHRGMTFLNFTSAKQLNAYQRCQLGESDVLTNKLARLKISQGAPLECREDIVYRYFPYKTYRISR